MWLKVLSEYSDAVVYGMHPEPDLPSIPHTLPVELHAGARYSVETYSSFLKTMISHRRDESAAANVDKDDSMAGLYGELEAGHEASWMDGEPTDAAIDLTTAGPKKCKHADLGAMELFEDIKRILPHGTSIRSALTYAKDKFSEVFWPSLA